jgi:hypothetical protein
MAVVAIHGKIKSGKDTVAKIWQGLSMGVREDDIVKALTDDQPFPKGEVRPNPRMWIKKQFAGKLKVIIAEMLDVPVERLEDEAFKASLLPDGLQVFELYINGVKQKAFLAREIDAKHWAEGNSSYFTKTYKKSQRTVRWLLQELGTPLLRGGIHQNIHIYMLFNQYTPYTEKALPEDQWSESYTHVACRDCGRKYVGYKRQARCSDCIAKEPNVYPNWLIPDLRFPNESDGVEEVKGLRITVKRPFAYRFPEWAFLIEPHDRQTYFDVPPNLYKNCSEEFYAKLTHASEVSLDDAVFEETIINDASLTFLVYRVKDIMLKYKLL